MNLQKVAIGILIMTAVLYVYTNLIETIVSDVTGSLDSLLMGFPLVMGTVVYFISDYLNKMFNK
jgi:hypothetical protein